jgi:hypothetical protein
MMDTGRRSFVWEQFIQNPQHAIANRKGRVPIRGGQMLFSI